MTSPPSICAITEHKELIRGDKLVLRGLKFHGYHGVKQEERKLGQKFLIDVDAWMDLRAAGTSDHLSDTISYTAIYAYSQISTVRVQVGKPHVAVHGPVDYLGVEIIRYRNADL
ncbi:dihydroneopterin aldolase 1 isoform X4 [Coffea arabica]|uniref:dihydroneopterin aldolase n=1 Tax=Coffea arabica TaxID=13443 RepID=A0ABM4URW1_COFAR